MADKYVEGDYNYERSLRNTNEKYELSRKLLLDSNRAHSDYALTVTESTFRNTLLRIPYSIWNYQLLEKH